MGFLDTLGKFVEPVATFAGSAVAGPPGAMAGKALGTWASHELGKKVNKKGGGGGVETVSNRPAYYDPASEEVFNVLKHHAYLPHEAYTGKKLANQPFSHMAAQQKGYQPNQYLPALEQNREQYQQLLNTNFPEAAQGYLQPYIENVYNPLADLLNQEYGRKLGGMKSQLVHRGQTASALDLQERAALEGERLRALGALGAAIYPEAVQTYQNDIKKQVGTLSDIMKNIQAEYGMGGTDIERLKEAGNLERGYEKEMLDQQLQDWLERQNYTKKNFQELYSLLSGIPATREVTNIPKTNELLNNLATGKNILNEFGVGELLKHFGEKTKNSEDGAGSWLGSWLGGEKKA